MREGRFSRRFGISEAAVARTAGLGRRTLAYWQAGEATPTLAKLRRLQAALEQHGCTASLDELADFYHTGDVR